MTEQKERIQLNLRLDGHKELYEAVKIAAADRELSVNAFVVQALKVAVGWKQPASVTVDTPTSIALPENLESRLAALESRLAAIEERQPGESLAA